MQWLRRLIRRNTKPIPQPIAHVWKRRMALAYGFLAWNALAVVVYAVYNGKRDWAEYHGLETSKLSPAENFSRMMDIPKAKVIRIHGVGRTEQFDIDNTEIFDNEVK